MAHTHTKVFSKVVCKTYKNVLGVCISYQYNGIIISWATHAISKFTAEIKPESNVKIWCA